MPISTQELRPVLTEICEDLLRETQVSRTTIRINLKSLGIDTSKPIAEAREPGISSLLEQIRPDQYKSGTVQYLMREQKLLLQESTRNPDPGAVPPEALITGYGTLAQVLGGLYRDGELIGWVSMHENRGTRKWTQDEAAAMERAVARVMQAVGDTP